MVEGKGRTEAVIGESAMERLAHSKVLIAGLGGVGGWAAEALVRVGLGALVGIDDDVIEASNINRQVFATQKTLGMDKVVAAEQRLHDINPHLNFQGQRVLLYEKNIREILEFYKPDFVLDAIDRVGSKGHLLWHCMEMNIAALTCLGASSRQDPLGFRIANLFETNSDPLARALRKSMRQRGVTVPIPAIFTTESPIISGHEVSSLEGSKFLGSYVPVVGAAGFLAADYVIKYLVNNP
jgi:tRNA A37 threonylcarbamoyladenosine dehydratase